MYRGEGAAAYPYLAPVAQLDRAASFYLAGCRFESCRGCNCCQTDSDALAERRCQRSFSVVVEDDEETGAEEALIEDGVR